MKLKMKLPNNRTYEQILNHYLVEKSLAGKLKEADFEARKQIYATMYDELFAKVPDHPRLTRRNSDEITAKANRNKLAVVKSFLDRGNVFVEFAPGDCRFSFEVAKYVKQVKAVDISDQRNLEDESPENFELIVYDGYVLNKIGDNEVDILFSDQLIEHFHPEDTMHHFQIAYRILKPGGKYVFRTPHFKTGPHDVSQYFSDEPECFHLKEWSYREMKKMLFNLNYSSFRTGWSAKGINFRLPYLYFELSEKLLDICPERLSKKMARYMIPCLYGIAVK